MAKPETHPPFVLEYLLQVWLRLLAPAFVPARFCGHTDTRTETTALYRILTMYAAHPLRGATGPNARRPSVVWSGGAVVGVSVLIAGGIGSMLLVLVLCVETSLGRMGEGDGAGNANKNDETKRAPALMPVATKPTMHVR